MAAVINGATALGALVNRAEELPFASPHFWTRRCRTWWLVEEKSDY
jgi:hypothetical protein